LSIRYSPSALSIRGFGGKSLCRSKFQTCRS